MCSTVGSAGAGLTGTAAMVAPRNANDKRYDRQLRIWGAHGQAALESARVCLLNAGTTWTLDDVIDL